MFQSVETTKTSSLIFFRF